MEREKDINKVFIISIVIVSILIISLITVLIRNLATKNREDNFAGEISSLDRNDIESESVSTKIGKNVEESKEDEDFEEIDLGENESTNITNSTKTTNIVDNNTIKTNSNVTEKQESKKEDKTKETNKEEIKQEEKNDKFECEAPIKGKIIREFAKDSLVFSNTLKEWITHNGVDIKSDKTSVVKSVANGTVTAIKNDPRYGLTVIINHNNGYQTVYSNLLTAEFVVKGEKVEKGQTIGTVGNSSSFESADDYHLHFELLRNNEYLDPSIYVKFE